jgi:hypothetical protein
MLDKIAITEGPEEGSLCASETSPATIKTHHYVTTINFDEQSHETSPPTFHSASQEIRA